MWPDLDKTATLERVQIIDFLQSSTAHYHNQFICCAYSSNKSELQGFYKWQFLLLCSINIWGHLRISLGRKLNYTPALLRREKQ